jgi:hypothetical protein
MGRTTRAGIVASLSFATVIACGTGGAISVREIAGAPWKDGGSAGASGGAPIAADDDGGDVLVFVEAGPPSSDYCARAEYDSGGGKISIYLLLDASDSMHDDHKWDDVSTALTAFVDDPKVAGVSIGLQFFPLGGSCDPELYATPAVPIAELPKNAQAIKTAMGKLHNGGGTPAFPALRGGIEYARSRMLLDPTERVVVALVTDGAPTTCDSNATTVAAVAAEGVSGTPQVLTFVVGLKVGYVEELAAFAAAGGTGDAILVGSDQSAQGFIDALDDIRNAGKTCRFAVPSSGVPVLAGDVTVGYALEQNGDILGQFSQVAGEADCAAHPSSFFVDDPTNVTEIQLCTAACSAVHSSISARVRVAAGCGLLYDGGAPDAADGGCAGAYTFRCVEQCGSGILIDPICVASGWTCPPGLVTTTSCELCPSIPHVCCKPDGTSVDAQCLNGGWTCPSGAPLYGEPGCVPGEVCNKKLSCGPSSTCRFPDFGCGATSLLGTCTPAAASCPPGSPPVCGCDGQTYDSSCEAASFGVDVSDDAPCATPSGRFRCGPLFCQLGSEACSHVTDYSKGFANEAWACETLPAGCVDGCDCGICPPCPPFTLCKENCGTPSGGPQVECSQLAP